MYKCHLFRDYRTEMQEELSRNIVGSFEQVRELTRDYHVEVIGAWETNMNRLTFTNNDRTLHMVVYYDER